MNKVYQTERERVEREKEKRRERERGREREIKRMVVKYRKDQKDETEGDRRRNSLEDEEPEIEERKRDT